MMFNVSGSKDESSTDGVVRPMRHRADRVDMTPMVDVTFLLLIFFMVTASFSLQKSIAMPRRHSDIPSRSLASRPEKESPVEVEIDADGSFLVRASEWQQEIIGKQQLVSTLKRAITEANAAAGLRVHVHDRAKLQTLVDAMDAGTIAGFTRLELVQFTGG